MTWQIPFREITTSISPERNIPLAIRRSLRLLKRCHFYTRVTETELESIDVGTPRYAVTIYRDWLHRNEYINVWLKCGIGPLKDATRIVRCLYWSTIWALTQIRSRDETRARRVASAARRCVLVIAWSKDKRGNANTRRLRQLAHKSISNKHRR